MDKKLISFDIWDTIIKRRCHPEEIKLFTARYIWLKYNNQIKEKYKDIYQILIKRDNIEADFCKEKEEKGLDGEYRILDVFNELQKCIFINEQENIDISKEWVRIEIEQEKAVSYVNPDILPILEKYKNLKMCCISDFYMSSKNLEEILGDLNLPVKFEKIYSSADYMLNKKSGNLYKKVQEEFEIKPEEHIHVGDNTFSDIEVAGKLGIETIKIKKEDLYFEPKRERKIKFRFDSIKKDNLTLENRLFNLGIELSPLLYFFNYNIIEYAIKNNIDTIYYFTREGERFIKGYETITSVNPFYLSIPKAQLLEVSRMATFSASLNNFSISELLRLWSQYRVQSMDTLFKTLAIDIEPYKQYFGKYDINIDEDIIEPWFDIRIQSLCKDDEFLSKINEELRQKRAELLEYFNKNNIIDDDKPMFMVDIGWRGTIQDNLAYIFSKKLITGYYVTLYDYYNVQPPNTKKIKFIKNRKLILEDISCIITVLEMIFSSNTGSVIKYKNGEAIRKLKKEEAQTVQNYINFIQAGMNEGSKIINGEMKIHPFEAAEFDNYVESIIKKIKQEPDTDLVNVYYDLVMNDTFGTGKYVCKKEHKLGTLERLNIFKCRRKLRTELWKEAYMKYNHIEYMKSIMNIKSSLRKIIGRK